MLLIELQQPFQAPGYDAGVTADVSVLKATTPDEPLWQPLLPSGELQEPQQRPRLVNVDRLLAIPGFEGASECRQIVAELLALLD